MPIEEWNGIYSTTIASDIFPITFNESKLKSFSFLYFCSLPFKRLRKIVGIKLSSIYKAHSIR